MLLSRNPALSRHPRVLLSGIPLYFLYLWPAATNVVALRPHLTSQTPFEVRSQGSTLHGPKGDQQQSPLGSPLPFRQHFRYLTKQQQRKGRDGNWSSFGLRLKSASALFENANASDGTSCTAKASQTSCQAHAIFFNVLNFY